MFITTKNKCYYTMNSHVLKNIKKNPMRPYHQTFKITKEFPHTKSLNNFILYNPFTSTLNDNFSPSNVEKNNISIHLPLTAPHFAKIPTNTSKNLLSNHTHLQPITNIPKEKPFTALTANKFT